MSYFLKIVFFVFGLCFVLWLYLVVVVVVVDNKGEPKCTNRFLPWYFYHFFQNSCKKIWCSLMRSFPILKNQFSVSQTHRKCTKKIIKNKKTWKKRICFYIWMKIIDMKRMKLFQFTFFCFCQIWFFFLLLLILK